MRGSIKGELLSPEGAAIPSYHEVLFNQQHVQTCSGQEVSADQASDSRADHNSVIRAIGCFLQPTKSSRQWPPPFKRAPESLKKNKWAVLRLKLRQPDSAEFALSEVAKKGGAGHS